MLEKNKIFWRKKVKNWVPGRNTIFSLYKKDLVISAEVDAFRKECGYLLVNL